MRTKAVRSKKRTEKQRVSLLSPAEEQELRADEIMSYKEYTEHLRRDAFERGVMQAGAKLMRKQVIQNVIAAERSRDAADDRAAALLQKVLGIEREEAEQSIRDCDAGR